jgi:hypothetical protein
MLVGLASLAFVAVAGETKLEVRLPLERAVYQTNEWIPLAVVRRASEALPGEALKLNLQGADGSRFAFEFPLPAVAVAGNDALSTTHLRLNGRLLKPGAYTLEAAAHGAAANAKIEVFSHLRKSSYRLVNWGRAKKPDEQIVEGEDSLGYNLFYGQSADDNDSTLLRAGVDFMSCCTMSGGHQIDLRSECDWSDPYAIRGGGTARVVRRALADRTKGNVPGVHFYDEPGLTWVKDPATGEMTPHWIPSQQRSFRSAFGREPLSYRDVKPGDPQQAAAWKHWAKWKLGFMDAAWKDAQFGVSYVNPAMISVTQSQYGFSAFTDGYYFNVARTLPVVSGHGGYDDWGPDFFNPVFTLDVARARDLDKPCWYLPAWYGSTPADRFRLEQYSCFMTNIQGMITPPDMDPYQPWKTLGAEGMVECNQLMLRLGPIFNTLPVNRTPVAVLYSLSHLIEKQTQDRNAVKYAHDDPHGRNLSFTYIALKMIQQPFQFVVDEDIVDGTLAANHQALVLTSIDYLAPDVVKGLERFIEDGGLVLLTGDCKVQIKGATNLGVTAALPDAEKIAQLKKENKDKEIGPLETLGKQLQGSEALAKALRAALAKGNVAPAFESDEPGIVASRQAAGDIEYLFALNADCDWNGPKNNVKATEATLTLLGEKKNVYDAVRGGLVAEFKDGLKAKLRLGPGQMRVFARTARPIGGVKVSTPTVVRDYTRVVDPIRVEIGAVLLDAQGGLLSGSAPLEIAVSDPLGNVRYNLYRATQQGTLTLSVPLALNDPAGEWKVVVSELLNGTQSSTTFQLGKVTAAGAAAGSVERAIFFEQDRQTIFRFFRVHQDVTLVVGTSPFDQQAAERLVEALKPWDVRCKIVTAAEVNKRREIPQEAMATWSGLEFGRLDDKYGPDRVGFVLQGPAILIGTPEDNPLIQFVQKARFLPYKPAKDLFPGRARGYLAWQRDAVGYGQESITVMAYDEAGMAEAAGTLFELAAGLEPLTPVAQSGANTVSPANAKPSVSEAAVAWKAVLPDRAVSFKAEGGKLVAVTLDGSTVELDAAGKILSQKAGDAPTLAAIPEVKKDALPAPAPLGYIAKHVAKGDALTAVGYWGGLVQIYAGNEVKYAQKLPQDITGLAWLDGKLAVALADGRVMALEVK